MSIIVSFLVPLVSVGMGFLTDSRLVTVAGSTLCFIVAVLLFCLDEKKQSISVAFGVLLPWIYFMAKSIFRF